MDTPALFATAWAILPPLVAIALALITKETNYMKSSAF